MRASNGSGSTTSPMPVTRARPPTRQNGTSAPSADGHVEVGRRRPSAARRRRRPTRRRARRRRGCACRRSTCAVRPTARSARAHEVVVVGGHVGADAPHHQPVAVGEGERVGQVEAHHLGVDQVVAVGAHAGHPQRPRELGGREHDLRHGRGPYVWAQRRHATARQTAASARRIQSASSSSSARASGRMPAAVEVVDGGQVGQRPPQHLAALAEAGLDQGEHRARGGVVAGRRVAPDVDERRTRPAAAARTPSASTLPTTVASAHQARRTDGMP